MEAVLALAKPELKAMLEQLVPLARDHKALRGRLNRMAVFAERTLPDKSVRPVTNVNWNATPEEELFYEHRKHYDLLSRSAVVIHEAIEGLTKPSTLKSSAEYMEQYLQLTKDVKDIETKALKRIDAMNEILVGLREQLADKERKMMTILHDRSMLVQQAMMHRDKMEVARDNNSTGDIKTRLAAKYGLSLQDLEKMIEAKPALLEEMDAIRIAQ